jgi:Tfp pilus assembly protein PilF
LKLKKEKTRQYERLEYAYSMLMKSNPQAALREIERLQMDIRDDKYLELKTWYLSAMIYHKMGKISRRKRAMRKMLEVMQELQKDPRFKRAFAEGKRTRDFIDMVNKSGGDKYAEFTE